MTYAELIEKFNKIEIENNLFSFNIEGIFPWKLIRIYIFSDLVSILTGNGDGHPNSKNRTYIEIIKSKILNYKLMLTKNAKRRQLHYDCIVFRHRRRINIDGNYIEVNTQYLDRWYDKTSNFLFVETGLAYENRNIQEDSLFLIASPLKLALKRRFYYKRTEKYINEINNISNEINNAFGTNLNVRKYVVRELAAYAVQYDLCSEFFAKTTPNEIVIVCSYGKEGIIQAARDLGVLVSEIQHGVITRYHTGYSFPISNIPYFPDQLYVYGDYWKYAAKYPIDIDMILPVGSPYFDQQFMRYHGSKKNINSILFISSGDIGAQLSKIAIDVFNKTKYNIIYKLHPSEFGVWNELYPWMSSFQQDGFVVVEDATNIFELYSKSEFIVGVNSTTLFESIAFECKMILVNLPGVDYMEDLISKYSIPVALDSNELVNMLQSYPEQVSIQTDSIYKRVFR